MGKVEIGNFCCFEFLFTQMFIEKFSMFRMTFVQIAQFDWLQGQHKWLIFEKVCFSKTINRLKVKHVKVHKCLWHRRIVKLCFIIAVLLQIF